MEPRNTEVEQDSVHRLIPGLGEDRRHIPVIRAPDDRPVAEFRQARLAAFDGLGVLVQPDHDPIGRRTSQDLRSMASGAERSVNIYAAGPRREQVDGLPEQNGNVFQVRSAKCRVRSIAYILLFFI